MPNDSSNGESRPQSPSNNSRSRLSQPIMINADRQDQAEDRERQDGSEMAPPDAPEANDVQEDSSQQTSPNQSHLGKRKSSQDLGDPEYPDHKRPVLNSERTPYLTLAERPHNDVDSARAAYAISQATSGGPSSHWWTNSGERRDSTASVYSNRSLNSSGGYNSASTAATSYSNMSLAEKLGGPLAPQASITAFPLSYAWPPAAPPIVQVTVAPPTNGNGAAAGTGAGVGASGPRGPLPPSESDRIAIDPALSSVRSGAQSPTAHGQYDDKSSMGEDSVVNRGNEAHSATGSQSGATFLSPPDDGTPNKDAPFSRSPELKVSHKLAERKRRKEMKDLFDELRDQLPADRGMKASKWEILSKAVDFITNMKQQHSELARENDSLRRELDMARAAGVAQAQAHAQGYTGQPHFHHPGYIPTQYPPAGPYAQAPPPPLQPAAPAQQQPQIQAPAPPASR